MKSPLRVLMSGGGTGGHIFPALAIADALRAEAPDADIRFVGAQGGMEMRLVPQHGYPIMGLPIRGLQRQVSLRNLLRNLQLPWRIWQSNRKARNLVHGFAPHLVVGTGGYASWPVLNAAIGKAAVTALQEQNAWPGLVNRKLAPNVDLVFLGNPVARQHLQAKRVLETGNPVRSQLGKLSRGEGCQRLGLNPNQPVLLVMGGSLGARSLNEAMLANLEAFRQSQVQVVWQCGRAYYDALQHERQLPEAVKLVPFLDDMAAAWAAADVALCRAGALTLAEVVETATPAVLVPSPHVAGNHQWHNAQWLVQHQAARCVPDADALQAPAMAMQWLAQPAGLAQARSQLQQLQQPRAAQRIAQALLEALEAKFPMA